MDQLLEIRQLLVVRVHRLVPAIEHVAQCLCMQDEEGLLGLTVQSTEGFELAPLRLHLVVPAGHLSRLVHVQVTHQPARDVDGYDSDEEVGAVGCQSLHVLELARTVLDEVDEVEEGEETTGSEVRAGVCAAEADFLPVAGLTPTPSKVGLVDGEVVEFVQSCLMVCIVAFVVVR